MIFEYFVVAKTTCCKCNRIMVAYNQRICQGSKKEDEKTYSDYINDKY